MTNARTIVAGLGEVGRPLLSILSRSHQCFGIDLEPKQFDGPCSILHICYPFQLPDFAGTTLAYVERFRPDLVIVNSTVAVGTCRYLQERMNVPLVYSPVRGKHVRMEQDMLRYKKFVSGFNPSSTQRAADHFAAAGFKVDQFSSPEIGELSKLLETTWLGMLVAWSQEIERMAAQYGGTYEQVNQFIEEIDFLPSQVFPGYIAGHCVMPNIALLQRGVHSAFLEAIVDSNQKKKRDLAVPTHRRSSVPLSVASD